MRSVSASSDHRRRDLPILMLTAEDTAPAEVHLLESGADDFVSKSADEDILLARIRAPLAKSSDRLPVSGGGEAPICPVHPHDRRQAQPTRNISPRN